MTDIVSDQPTFEDRVRSLLAEITLDEACLRTAPDVPLENIGIDSVGMIDLVYGLEERFVITIEDHEVMPENFGSIAALTALVTRKCG